jgi:hypothetical protein
VGDDIVHASEKSEGKCNHPIGGSNPSPGAIRCSKNTVRNGKYTLVVAPAEYPGMRYRGRYVYEHHLLCSNCHRELHDEIRPESLAVQLRELKLSALSFLAVLEKSPRSYVRILTGFASAGSKMTVLSCRDRSTHPL